MAIWQAKIIGGGNVYFDPEVIVSMTHFKGGYWDIILANDRIPHSVTEDSGEDIFTRWIDWATHSRRIKELRPCP